jgi:hypothetical protein
MFSEEGADMRNSIKITGAALLCTALLAAGPASAHGRDHYRGGGAPVGAMLAIGALLGLAVGTAVASQPVVVAQPAPVQYAPAPVSYAPPQVPPGYCYRDYDRAYVPCGGQPAGYYPAQPAYSY